MQRREYTAYNKNILTPRVFSSSSHAAHETLSRLNVRSSRYQHQSNRHPTKLMRQSPVSHADKKHNARLQYYVDIWHYIVMHLEKNKIIIVSYLNY